MGLIIGGVSASDLILDGQSVSLYVGGNPPVKVWPTRETVQITLGTGLQAHDRLRAALADRGLDHKTVTEIPFDIKLVGTGSLRDMFYECAALTSVPAMDTSQVTDMASMFQGCVALNEVPDMDTRMVTDMRRMFWGCPITTIPPIDTLQVTNMYAMFYQCNRLTYVPDMQTGNVADVEFMFRYCSALTDGNVRLIGKRPGVATKSMISQSGLTRLPFYNAAGNPI